ncbi:MAG: hypothetical protein GEU83_14355 [Pseudonocardiaceae bacterium]|nr:hypothetical protein [Pseudonocardiaceae bacterium]
MIAVGTFLTGYGEAGYEHEGYAAFVLDDGTLSATYGPETRPRMVGQFVAACGCGWTGATRYACADGDPLDEDAEELALGEWERSHARPVLEQAQRGELGRLRAQLRQLAVAQLSGADDYRPPLQRARQLDGVVEALEAATARARRLRDQAHEQAERNGGA